MSCVLCKNAEVKSVTKDGKKSAVCPICGEILYAPVDAYLCYGDRKSKRVDVLFTVSDRYIFFHKLKGFERPIYALGIIGGIILAAIVRTFKENRMPYSFIDLNDVDRIIAPYKNKKYKKDDAMKVIMKDGTDFIIKTSSVSIMPTANFLSKSGVKLVDGTSLHHGETFCERPYFVAPNTIGRSVAPSAASKIKMMKKNFVAPAVAHTAVTSNSAAQVFAQAFGKSSSATPSQTAQSHSQPQPSAVADEPPYRSSSAPQGTPSPSSHQAPKNTPTQSAASASQAPFTVAELNMRVATYNSLAKNGINYVSQLLEKTARDLRSLGIGEIAIDEIQHTLSQYSLSLKPLTASYSEAPAASAQEKRSEPIITPPPASAAYDTSYQPKVTPVADEPPYQPRVTPVADEPPYQPRVTPVADEPPYQPKPKKDPNVKFCRKCGEKIRRDDVFCPECGADQR